MANIQDSIQKEIEKIWPQAKKNVSKINKDVVKLLKKSEKKLVEAYATAKKKTEQLVFKAKREELYYELGKKVAPLLTSDQLKNKNIMKISTEIRQLTKRLRSKE